MDRDAGDDHYPVRWAAGHHPERQRLLELGYGQHRPPLRRSRYNIGIGYGDIIEEARAAILEAIAKVEAVVSDPAPEVIVFDLAASSVNLRVR